MPGRGASALALFGGKPKSAVGRRAGTGASRKATRRRARSACLSASRVALHDSVGLKFAAAAVIMGCGTEHSTADFHIYRPFSFFDFIAVPWCGSAQGQVRFQGARFARDYTIRTCFVLL